MIYIIDDVWEYIKEYLFHNIKTQGKHLKDDKNIKNYNIVIEKIPLLVHQADTARIIYNSGKDKTGRWRFLKFIYVIKHKRVRRLIIEYQYYSYTDKYKFKWGWKREDLLHNKFREEYYSNIKNADNKD